MALQSPLYLNRHLPNYLTITELKELSADRLRAYIKKNRALLHSFKHESYNYSSLDQEYNGEYGTNVERQMKEYFKTMQEILKAKQ